MDRTIKVTGKAKLAVRPDTVRVTILMSEVFKKYEEAVQESAEKKNILTESLKELGFEKKDLKTTLFSTEPEYESYQSRNGNWKNRLKGYRYTHNMKLEFSIDNARLGRVFHKLANCPGAPQFRVQYIVNDPEPAKNRLLSKAVNDSREKAGILADAAGVKLGEIVLIDYSWGEIELKSKVFAPMMFEKNSLLADADESYEMDIEADDINIEDSVTVVWQIGKSL